mmetsp:Transcript_22398/g.40399  ORF Transcript_22398/g.40399 Transcript_22398/m.40399 type:complete len:290 (+) Transcript_22398:217-1086(+)
MHRDIMQVESILRDEALRWVTPGPWRSSLRQRCQVRLLRIVSVRRSALSGHASSLSDGCARRHQGGRMSQDQNHVRLQRTRPRSRSSSHFSRSAHVGRRGGAFPDGGHVRLRQPRVPRGTRRSLQDDPELLPPHRRGGGRLSPSHHARGRRLPIRVPLRQRTRQAGTSLRGGTPALVHGGIHCLRALGRGVPVCFRRSRCREVPPSSHCVRGTRGVPRQQAHARRVRRDVAGEQSRLSRSGSRDDRHSFSCDGRRRCREYNGGALGGSARASLDLCFRRSQAGGFGYEC